MKLSVKMLGSGLALSLIAVAIGLTGVFSIQKINQRSQSSYEDSTQGLIHLQGMESNFLQMRLAMYKVLAVQSDELTKALRVNMAVISKNWQEDEQGYSKTIDSSDEKTIFATYTNAKSDYLYIVDQCAGMIEQKQFAQALAYIAEKGVAVAQAMTENTQKLIKFNVKAAEKGQQENQNEGYLAMVLMVGLSALGFLVALVTGLFLTRSVTRAVGGEPAVIAAMVDQIALGKLHVEWDGRRATGIRKSMEAMTNALQLKAAQIERLASGDLRTDIKAISAQDELAFSLIKLNDSLNHTIQEIIQRMEQTVEGATQVASASQSLSQSSTEQAAGLEEITSTITELSSQTQKNASDAQSASSLAQEALKSADNGNLQMKELVQAMNAINASSEDIKKIIKVIDDISFQINLLALNANVEAARAGKYGRGFAVVADEVRNLAVKSSQAVKETTDMVNDSIRNIGNGGELVKKTAVQLEQISHAAAKVNDIVSEIASASKEQAVGLTQIEQALGQIDSATQANTATSEETASASQELNSQAQNVQKLLLSFQLKDRQPGGKEALPGAADRG